MSKNKKSKNTQSEFVVAHRPYNNDFLETMTRMIHWSRWFGIVGLERFIWKLWGFLLLILLLIIEGEAIWKLIKAFAGWAKDTTGRRSITARLAGTMLYTAALLCLIQCWRLSGMWIEISTFWTLIDWSLNIKYVSPDKMIQKKIHTIVFFVGVFAATEQLLAMASSFDFDCKPSLCLRQYILHSHGFMLLEHEYSDWIAVSLLFMNIIAKFLWNLQDLIIILMSVGLSSRYHRLNQCVEIVSSKIKRPKRLSTTNNDEEFLKTYIWRKIRDAYVKQSILVRKVDKSLGVLILLSAFFNFYFICLLLFLRITHGSSLSSIRQVYYMVSLTWICIRTGYTVLAAANVNNSSTMALPYLYEVPAEFFNIEIERLQKQLSNDYVALTGMGFFNLNRTFVLQMAGVVVTFVLILVQYDDSDVQVVTSNSTMT